MVLILSNRGNDEMKNWTNKITWKLIAMALTIALLVTPAISFAQGQQGAKPDKVGEQSGKKGNPAAKGPASGGGAMEISPVALAGLAASTIGFIGVLAETLDDENPAAAHHD